MFESLLTVFGPLVASYFFIKTVQRLFDVGKSKNVASILHTKAQEAQKFTLVPENQPIANSFDLLIVDDISFDKDYMPKIIYFLPEDLAFLWF